MNDTAQSDVCSKCGSYMCLSSSCRWVRGVHVEPGDGDVDSLTTKTTRIAAEIFDLAAEAIRVRDQHRAVLDSLKSAHAALKADRDAARRDYQALACDVSDLRYANEIAALKADRDDARRDYQALALKHLDDANHNHKLGVQVAQLLQQKKYLVRVVERVDAALTAGMRADLPADWLATLAALGETVAPVAPVAPAAVPVPIEVLAWAKRECTKLSKFAHPTATFEPVPGVSVDVLRAWTEAIDAASYVAAQVADAADAAPVLDAGAQSPVVERVRAAARAVARTTGDAS